jgi:CRISPR-associated exonuclease Cas4
MGADPMIWLALAVLVIGFLFILTGKSSRHRRGLSAGRTLDLDTRVLHSRRFRLVGRPDRLFRDGNAVIPEEWKSSHKVYKSHIAQLGAYLILVEEEYGVRPPYGVISFKGSDPVRIENTPELRAWVLDVADLIRASRLQLADPIQVNQPAAKCRACGMREGCGQKMICY